MESNYFIELHDGVEVYYPLGIGAWGAATAVVLTSPEAKRAARRSTQLTRHLGNVCAVLMFSFTRLLGAGFFAVPADLLIMALHNSITARRAKHYGQPLPPKLARSLCAAAIDEPIVERILQSWMMLAMVVASTLLFGFGNLPAFWTWGAVSMIVFSLHNLIQWHRLAAAAFK